MSNALLRANNAMWSRREALILGSAAILSGSAPRSAWGRTQADVIVIGAGLAGLNAARLLEAAGQRVIVIEAENRVGGRLHTLDDMPGRPEAGGIQVGSGYHQTRRIAAALGISLNEAPASAGDVPSALFDIGGQTVTSAQWPTSPVNHLAGNEKQILPSALGFHYGRKLARLKAVQDWMTADPALDISYAQALSQAGASVEALRLIEANLNGNTLIGISQISILRNVAAFLGGPGPIATIKGGSQRLPEAMAAALNSPVRYSQAVRAIREDANGVSVVTKRRSFHARYAICTIPFAALKTVSVEAELTPELATMISTLPYTRASFAYISATEAFWKNDSFPETLWTDDPLLGRIFVLSENPPMLKLWTTGAGADRLDNMEPEQAAAAIIDHIERARPSAKGKLKLLRFFSWQKNPFARGIYHHIGTGQATTLAAATQAAGSRLYFAGEHLAQNQIGMEGALESGERAANEIIRLHA